MANVIPITSKTDVDSGIQSLIMTHLTAAGAIRSRMMAGGLISSNPNVTKRNQEITAPAMGVCGTRLGSNENLSIAGFSRKKKRRVSRRMQHVQSTVDEGNDNALSLNPLFEEGQFGTDLGFDSINSFISTFVGSSMSSLSDRLDKEGFRQFFSVMNEAQGTSDDSVNTTRTIEWDEIPHATYAWQTDFNGTNVELIARNAKREILSLASRVVARAGTPRAPQRLEGNGAEMLYLPLPDFAFNDLMSTMDLAFKDSYEKGIEDSVFGRLKMHSDCFDIGGIRILRFPYDWFYTVTGAPTTTFHTFIARREAMSCFVPAAYKGPEGAANFYSSMFMTERKDKIMSAIQGLRIKGKEAIARLKLPEILLDKINNQYIENYYYQALMYKYGNSLEDPQTMIKNIRTSSYPVNVYGCYKDILPMGTDGLTSLCTALFMNAHVGSLRVLDEVVIPITLNSTLFSNVPTFSDPLTFTVAMLNHNVDSNKESEISNFATSNHAKIENEISSMEKRVENASDSTEKEHLQKEVETFNSRMEETYGKDWRSEIKGGKVTVNGSDLKAKNKLKGVPKVS